MRSCDRRDCCMGCFRRGKYRQISRHRRLPRGDAISSGQTSIDALAQLPAMAMLIGAALSMVWAVTGALLARAHRRRVDESA